MTRWQFLAAACITLAIRGQIAAVPHGHRSGRVEALQSRDNGGPCWDVAQKVMVNLDARIEIGADLALSCLESVPIVPSDAESAIESIKRLLQYQSTLDYLKDEDLMKPTGQDPIDIIGELDGYLEKIRSGELQKQYELETLISRTMRNARDDHLDWDGSVFVAFRWYRPKEWALVSVAVDDEQLPKIFVFEDVQNNNLQEVKMINDRPASEFLIDEAKNFEFHSKDARYNDMFVSPSVDGTLGRFIRPVFHPDNDTTLEFTNGSSFTRPNKAYARYPIQWTEITDAASAYSLLAKRHQFLKRNIPTQDKVDVAYAEDELDLADRSQSVARRTIGDYHKVAQHPDPGTRVSGYLIQTGPFDYVGVLVLGTFVDASHRINDVVEEFIEACKNSNVFRIIIDLRSNDGGTWGNLHPTFSAFFPNVAPKVGHRMRAHEAAALMGPVFEKHGALERIDPAMVRGQQYDVNGNPINTWAEVYGPQDVNGMSFSNVVLLDFSPSEDSSPFLPSDIVLLSDGRCSSSCAFFTELMTQEVKGVKTVTIGGEPALGPSEVAGGVKGTGRIFAQYIEDNGLEYQEITDPDVEPVDTELMPFVPPIRYSVAQVNYYDVLRPPAYDTPTQFIFDASDCRIMYDTETLLDNRALYLKVARIALNGNVNTALCLPNE